MAKIIVSGCLMGCECRYKGDSCKNEEVLSLGCKHTLIPVCPEQLGGLATPRDPAEICGERIISSAGRDVTYEYKKGAETALYIAKQTGADAALFKANSPSCGKGIIYDGTFTGNKTAGDGVTAKLFSDAGIKVFTEGEIKELLSFLGE
ncbi:MAG: DUF523 domain-containing protein [Acutalibacteraceae bacterium]